MKKSFLNLLELLKEFYKNKDTTQEFEPEPLYIEAEPPLENSEINEEEEKEDEGCVIIIDI